MTWASDETIGSGKDRTNIHTWQGVHEDEEPSGGECIGRLTGNPSGSNIYFSGHSYDMDATNKMVLIADTGNFTDGTDGSGDDAIVGGIPVLTESTYAYYIDFIGLEFATRSIIGPDGGGVLQYGNCYWNNTPLGAHGSTLEIYAITNNLTINVGGGLFKSAAGGANGTSSILVNDTQATVNVCNCTIYTNTAVGAYRVNGTLNVINTISDNTSSADFSVNGTFSNCASGDATSPDAGTDNITAADEWTNPATGGTGDFTVKDTDAVIYQAGTDQPTWFDDITGGVDMGGTSWHTTTPSIGCFELEAAGGGFDAFLAVNSNILLQPGVRQ